MSKFQFVQFNMKNVKLSPEKNPKRKNNTTFQGEYVLSYQFSKMIVLFTSRYDQLDGWLAMSKPQKEHPRQGQIRTPEYKQQKHNTWKKEKGGGGGNPALIKTQSQKKNN